MEFLKKIEPRGPLSCDTVLKIFYQTCRAVQHMHRQKPPIIHRDLKVPPGLLRACTAAPRQESSLLQPSARGFSREEGCGSFLTSNWVSGSFSQKPCRALSPYHLACSLLRPGPGLHAPSWAVMRPCCPLAEAPFLPPPRSQEEAAGPQGRPCPRPVVTGPAGPRGAVCSHHSCPPAGDEGSTVPILPLPGD